MWHKLMMLMMKSSNPFDKKMEASSVQLHQLDFVKMLSTSLHLFVCFLKSQSKHFERNFHCCSNCFTAFLLKKHFNCFITFFFFDK